MARIFYSRDCERIPGGAGELYDIIVHRLRGGDVLVVPDVSHICKRWYDLRMIIDCLAGKGVVLSPQFTDRRAGESAEAGFKHDLRRAATERAKASGSYSANEGRPQKADPALARKLKDSGVPDEMIATTLGVSPRTVSRYSK
jgi:hypothetical protein